MAYCSKQDLEEVIGANKINNWADSNPVHIEKAISRASSEIDGYLISGGYTVPLDPVPENIRNYCVDLAAYNLLSRKGIMKDDAGDQGIVNNQEKAIAFLEKVAKGIFSIPRHTTANQETSTPDKPAMCIQAKVKMQWGEY